MDSVGHTELRTLTAICKLNLTQFFLRVNFNRQFSQMRVLLAAYHELAVEYYNTLSELLYAFEHKM